jgi:hypothetical protein
MIACLFWGNTAASIYELACSVLQLLTCLAMEFMQVPRCRNPSAILARAVGWRCLPERSRRISYNLRSI